MAKITIQKTENFTVLDNTLFKDDSLSWKAKGLLAYLLHLPNDWQIYLEDLKNRSTDGKESTRTAINELIEKGYILRIRVHENGKFKRYDYTVFEKPTFQKSENQKSENQKSENQSLVNTNLKKELNKVKTKDIYIDVFNYYLSKNNLIKHKNLSSDMKKAIDLAIKTYELDLDYLKRIIDRHSEKVEQTKNNGQFAIRVRTITQLFGQKIKESPSLICSVYLDEVYKKSEIKEKKSFTKDIAGYKLKSL